MTANYLTGPNPFGMQPPPAWWLAEMALFDPRLVLVPGQRNAVFVLARRARQSAGEPLHDVRGLSQNPDTVFLRMNRMVRVCEILPGVVWDMRIFAKLAAHDIERLGGAQEVASKLDTLDQTKRDQLDAAQDSELHARSQDAYKAYKTQIGERLSLAHSPHGRGSVTRNPVSVHVRASNPASLAP